jgi:RNA polymerase sigma factor (sigma-70 family)
MDLRLDDEFIKQVNEHMGIAHKVSRLYFKYAEERDDVLQEMMFQLWRSFKRFDGRSKFSTWMYSVCLNTALTYSRKNRNRKEQPLDSKHDQIADESSQDKDQAINLLLKAIESLTPINKAIVLLYLENMSYEEIAGITGLTKTNVSVRLVRIKRQLELQLKKEIKSIE